MKLLSRWAFDRCEETASCSQQDVYVCSTRSPRFTFHSPARRNAGEKSEYLSVICSVGIGGSYSINDFMQKALPPDFSNSEVSTMTGSSPSFCSVSLRLLVRWEVM